MSPNSLIKKIIIIGATSGIGREMAEMYAAKNYKVGIIGRRENLLNQLKEKYPQQIFVSCFDVMGNENQQKVQQLIDELGGLEFIDLQRWVWRTFT